MRSSRRVAKRGFLAGLVAAGSLVAFPAFAKEDAVVQQRIEARLAEARLDQGADIQVEVKDGVATLRGITLSLPDRLRAEQAARKEAKAVEDLVRVFPEKRKDADIEKDVGTAVLGSVYYGVFDSVGVAVQDGEVTLRGSVLQPYHKDDILARVVRVPGIRELKDEVRVQPASFNDDRLRRELYRKIYANPKAILMRFAGTIDPPVRIVVENGHVTLTGYVGTPLEKTVVGTIARGTLAFTVENQVQLEKDRRKETTRAANES